MSAEQVPVDAADMGLSGKAKKRQRLQKKLSTIVEGEEVVGSDDDEPKTYEVFGEGDERNDLGREAAVDPMVNGVRESKPKRRRQP